MKKSPKAAELQEIADKIHFGKSVIVFIFPHFHIQHEGGGFPQYLGTFKRAKWTLEFDLKQPKK